MRLRAFFSLGLTCALASACSYYDTSLLEPATQGDPGGSGGGGAGGSGGANSSGSAGSSDAGSGGSAGSSGSAGASPQCTHVFPPGPPSQSEEGGSTELVFVASSLDFGDREDPDLGPDYKRIGYDLDQRCTCDGADSNSCLMPKQAPPSVLCDGDGGIDNASGAFIHELRTSYFKSAGTENWSKGIQNGDWSLIIRVRNYNGLPNDDQVAVDWLVPARFDALTDDDSKPTFDGTDVWPVKDLSFLPGDDETGVDINKPKASDPKAYVTNGMLVASLPTSALQVSDELTLTIQGAFLTAQIAFPEDNGGQYALKDGVVAARWRVQDLLSQLSRFKDPFSNSPVCKDNVIYGAFKDKICAFADIYSGISTPTTPCDSLSVGLAFTAVPVTIGPVVPEGAVESPCAPENDPANDNCSNLPSAARRLALGPPRRRPSQRRAATQAPRHRWAGDGDRLLAGQPPRQHREHVRRWQHQPAWPEGPVLGLALAAR